MTDRWQIASSLARLRRQAGMTLEDVASKIGKSYKTVGGWEHGRGQPDVETFLKLCDMYGVTDILREFAGGANHNEITTTPHEQSLIHAYRSNPPMQEAVDKLLGLEPEHTGRG